VTLSQTTWCQLKDSIFYITSSHNCLSLLFSDTRTGARTHARTRARARTHTHTHTHFVQGAERVLLMQVMKESRFVKLSPVVLQIRSRTSHVCVIILTFAVDSIPVQLYGNGSVRLKSRSGDSLCTVRVFAFLLSMSMKMLV
jgi:hypothetical protein